MLSNLKLKDLILIEEAEIEFGASLNIFTGETGAGKSAILSAIRLIAGERADSEWVRDGAAMAVVEARLSKYLPETLGDIAPQPPNEPLHIRREVHRSGKSRCFVEDQLVSVTGLREIVRPLIQMVDQSSSLSLDAPEEQMALLDAYADVKSEAAELASLYDELMDAQNELAQAQNAKERRARDLERAQTDLDAILEANWKQDEEESLSKIHRLLTHAQEIAEKVGRAAEGLAAIAPRLRQISHSVDSALSLDPELRSPAEELKTASIEIDEAERFLRSYASKMEADPARLSLAEDRIRVIETLKKRFGRSWKEVEEKKNQLRAEIDRLLTLDETTERLVQTLQLLEDRTRAAALFLSQKRQAAAPAFSKAILLELKSLNLPYASFQTRIAPKQLSARGTDEIAFLFAANPGLSPLPLDQCASGGELSRLLLAVKIVLSEKEHTHCLVFDEIDSNVGGQTASVLGEKLKKLSDRRQVICVTHFVQVARFALHHYAVSKIEKEGRAKTLVELLKGAQREREYARMIGK